MISADSSIQILDPTNIETTKSFFYLNKNSKPIYYSLWKNRSNSINISSLMLLGFCQYNQKITFCVCICTYEGLRICIPCLQIQQDPCLTCTVAHAPSFVSLIRSVSILFNTIYYLPQAASIDGCIPSLATCQCIFLLLLLFL